MKPKGILMMILFILLIAGCSQQDKEEVSEVGEKAETVAEQETEAEIEQTTEVFPLTGKESNEGTDARAIAVIVNNHPLARPQSGLQDADFVYEVLAEGEVTRFLAIYQSQFPDKVGPVRSARNYYMQLAKGLDAIFIHHGYSTDAKELLDDGYIEHLDGMTYDGTLFVRDKSRNAPHNSYIAFDDIIKGAEQNSFDLEGAPKPLAFLTEEEIVSLTGEDANVVTVKYGSSSFDVTYEYNEAEQKYERSVKGTLTVDNDTGYSVLLDNVAVIEAPHKIIDDGGLREIDLKSGGEGYLLRNGKRSKIQWINENDRIVLLENGEEAKLVPGSTWVNIIPDQPGIEEKVIFQ